MVEAFAGRHDLARSTRSLSTRSPSMRSLMSGSKRNWASASIREVWVNQGDMFQKSGREEDEEELKWAAIERLPTYDRLRKGMLKQVRGSGSVRYEEVDVANLDVQGRRQLIESILKVAEEDNETFLRKLRERTDRVGIVTPKIEVRFEHLSVEGDAYVGTRALPTLVDVAVNKIEGLLGFFRLSLSKKRVVNILHDVSGIVEPMRPLQKFMLSLNSTSMDLGLQTTYSCFPAICACQIRNYWKNPRYNAMRFFMTLTIGLIFGLIFWNQGQKINKQQDLFNLLGAMYSAVIFLGATNTSSVMSIVSIERTVFYRERAAGMYSELPYAFAQVSIEGIYVAIQAMVYSILLYVMIGFSWEFTNFLWFYFFIFTAFMYFTLYGMMLVSLTPGHQPAAIVMSFFLSFWNLFSGFLVPRTQIPLWWRWYYWASPVSWTIYGLITSQVGNLKKMIEIPEVGPVAVKDFLKARLGFEYDFLGAVAAAHIGFVVLFLFSFAYGIKYLNFQRR